MEKIKVWFKGTSFYFWWGVVLSSLDFSEIRGEIMSGGRLIIVTVIAALFSTIFLGRIVELNGLVVQGLVTIAFTVILYIGVQLFYTPAKLYFDAQRKADRFTWNDVLMIINHKEHYGACIVVTNNKLETIGAAGAELVHLEKGGKIEQIARMPLVWAKKNGYTPSRKNLDRKGGEDSQRILVVAQCNKTEGWIETRISKEQRDEGKIPIEIDINYKIRIQWFGVVGSRGMDEYTRDYWLEYDGEKVTIKEVK